MPLKENAIDKGNLEIYVLKVVKLAFYRVNGVNLKTTCIFNKNVNDNTFKFRLFALYYLLFLELENFSSYMFFFFMICFSFYQHKNKLN